MKVQLPIDPFQITQVFGVNRAAYEQFGMIGHNGWDIRTIYPDTPNGKRFILATQDSTFFSKGNEGTKGYGLYFEVKTKTSKNTWKHTFAHCDSIESFSIKRQGEKLAISDNTGNSTASHLHWTVKRLNADGSVKDYNNGYFGAVNPQEYVDEVRAEVSNSDPTMEEKIIRKAVITDKLVNYLYIVKMLASSNSDIVTYEEIQGSVEALMKERDRLAKKATITDKIVNTLNLGDADKVKYEDIEPYIKGDITAINELKRQLAEQKLIANKLSVKLQDILAIVEKV